MTYRTECSIPTSVKEVEALGWDWIDVIFFTGDAFVDHPSFGTACIARYLEKAGYRVAVVPQPNWRDDLRDFRKLGAPRLYFAVNAGAMDSMVNHYTAAKRLRHDDAYTPEGRAGARPDRAVTVYARILKELWPEVPVVIGGVEASLRRLTHYDYWDDRLMPSILVDSGADWLCYGMGERPMLELTRAIESGRNTRQIEKIPQLAFYRRGRAAAADEPVGGGSGADLHVGECRPEPRPPAMERPRDGTCPGRQRAVEHRPTVPCAACQPWAQACRRQQFSCCREPRNGAADGCPRPACAVRRATPRLMDQGVHLYNPVPQALIRSISLL